MKKKFLLAISMVALLVCAFAITASAAMTGSTSNEFGEKISLDGMSLSGMATDDGSRVVLQHTVDGVTYYNTYPANYIVTNKSYNRIDYANVNAALDSNGETFTYDDTSVIRLEMPSSSTNTNSEIKAMSNLKELIFMPGSSQTSFKTQEFLGASFERVVIPSSITDTGNGNVFQNCINLKEVVFQDGFSCTSLGNSWFSGCTSIVSFTVPSSVTKIGSNFFKGCTSLKEVRMENVTSFGQYWLAGCTDVIKLYVSKEVTGFGQFSYDSTNPKAVVFYTGDFDGASAIKEAGTKVIKNASLVEYDITKPDSYYVPTSPEAWTIVYDYSICNAFYNREHENDISPCVINCDRCSTYGVAKENPIHSIASDVKYSNYAEKGLYIVGCTNEGCTYAITEEMSPLFTCLGYSANEIGGDGIAIGYLVNNEAIDDYTSKTGKSISYGVFVASQNKLGENDIFDQEGNKTSGVVSVEITSYEFAVFELKVVGFTDSNKGSLLAMGAYVKEADGESAEYSYMQDDSKGEFNGKYYFASYNDIVGKPSV